MRLHPTSSKRRARIEIIPLIDIIFFLLATFVMVSFSMVKNQGLPVRLPKASTGVAQERNASATITVNGNGELYLDKEKVAMPEMLNRLTKLKNENPVDYKVFVNGDELAYYGDVVSVLDRVRQAGIDKIAIQTRGGSFASPPAALGTPRPAAFQARQRG